MEKPRTAQSLWQDYQFLTKEMRKFLDKQDMEMLHELLDQRERLQSLIEEGEDEGFKHSTDGRIILAEIQADNQYILANVQILFSRGKQYQHASKAYNNINTTTISRLNWKR